MLQVQRNVFEERSRVRPRPDNPNVWFDSVSGQEIYALNRNGRRFFVSENLNIRELTYRDVNQISYYSALSYVFGQILLTPKLAWNFWDGNISHALPAFSQSLLTQFTWETSRQNRVTLGAYNVSSTALKHIDITNNIDALGMNCFLYVGERPSMSMVT